MQDAPPGWDITEMNEEMPSRWDEGPVRILVWEIIDLDYDERVLERCLVIKTYKKPPHNGEACALGYLARNPKAEKPVWKAQTLWITPDAELKNPPVIWGAECYPATPSDEEIGKFLTDRAWAVEISRMQVSRLVGGVSQENVIHPKVTNGGVCLTAWREAFGRDPNPALFSELAKGDNEK